AQLARVNVVDAASAAVQPAKQSAERAAPAGRGPLATIRDIRRTVLPDAVRITIELDGEVAFHDERIEDPPRVFVDLPGTRAPPVASHTLTTNWSRRFPTGSPASTALLASARAAAVAPRDRAQAAPETQAPAPAVLPSTAVAPPAAKTTAGGLTIARQLGLGVSRIVIDPGHGGHDPGAKGKGLTEAELVLDVALRVEKLLQKVPGVEVILTRRTDDFTPLPERTAIDNREGADLFLSIHAN